jgi:predicted aspartyl protease
LPQQPVQPPQALTLTGAGLLAELRTVVRIGEPYTVPGQQTKITNDLSGIWDTGATGSVVTQQVVNDLGLAPISMAQIHGVSGIAQSPVYLVSILLPMGVTFGMMRVTLGNLPVGTDVLIGMDVITAGDFAISNKKGVTKMSFRVPSAGDWDFVKEIKTPNREARRAEAKKKRKGKP